MSVTSKIILVFTENHKIYDILEIMQDLFSIRGGTSVKTRMTKPRKLRSITITLFDDQIEKLRVALAKHGANISGYLRTVIDKELLAEGQQNAESEDSNA